ncbi:hypothetical protein FA15DRAFT_670872, partial [Coprinopsis marcescibilis]
YHRQPDGQHQRNLQEIYEQSNVPASPADQRHTARPPASKSEVVRSSIPVALDLTAKSAGAPAPKPQPVTTKIVWRGGGYNVVLARAGHDEWKGRTIMQRESPVSPNFITMVDLLPGTHHIRFLVDDQWRVADDLPTAVDDQGSLANYVAVPFGLPKAKDPSFFVESAPPTPPPQRTHKDVPNPVQQEQWTNILPPELLEAFKEEEMYLAANQGQVDPNTNHHRVSGFIPAPNIPPAPSLPRHLDKLILNMRVSPGPSASAIKTTTQVGNAASVVQSGLPGGVGSGQGSSGRQSRRDRERTREERREERRRGRERGYSDATGSRRGPPPPPPPTEVGEIGPSSAERIAEYVPPTISEHAVPEASSTTDPLIGSADTADTLVPSIASTATSTAHTTPLSSPPLPAPAGLVNSRTITIDTNNMPSLTDDASVLPVPSHVVLHHLCTSAIRNGVLAVASTTRYRKKYLTTIYYKPT